MDSQHAKCMNKHVCVLRLSDVVRLTQSRIARAISVQLLVCCHFFVTLDKLCTRCAIAIALVARTLCATSKHTACVLLLRILNSMSSVLLNASHHHSYSVEWLHIRVYCTRVRKPVACRSASNATRVTPCAQSKLLSLGTMARGAVIKVCTQWQTRFLHSNFPTQRALTKRCC